MLVLAVALIPLPVAASDGPPARSTTTGKMSLHQAVAREAARTPLIPAPAVARADRVRADRAVRADQGSGQSTTFFKTRPGQIALAVMAIGTGYAIYSAKHDKITSPARGK